MARLGLFSALACLRLGQAARAEPGQVPVQPTWPHDRFGVPANRQSDFCSVSLDGANVSSGMLALSGRKVAVAVNLGGKGQSIVNFAKYDPATGLLTGYLVDVMDEMARRGGFTWRKSFALVNITEDEDDDDPSLVVWATRNYDLWMDWVTPRRERIVAGVNHLVPFMDTSYHLLVRPVIDNPSVWQRVFSFLAPLSWGVWLALVAIALVTAYAYKRIEAGQADFGDEDVKGQPFIHSAYMTLGTFTGVAGFSPATHAGKFLNFSCAFLVLLVVSAYTANLASMLVVNGSVAIPIQSLEEAAVKGIPVCTAFNHPAFARMHRVHWKFHGEDVETYKGVRDGVCEVGIVRHFMWNIARHERSINPCCGLYMIEGSLVDERSGFTTSLESSGRQLCIARAAQVFNLLLVTMQNDGFFESLNNKYRTLNADSMACPLGLPAPSQASSGSLSLQSMSGIFATYLVAVVIACAVHETPRLSAHSRALSLGDSDGSGSEEPTTKSPESRPLTRSRLASQ